MIYRRGMVITFSPGSGWPSFVPGSVDVKYHGNGEFKAGLSERVVRLDDGEMDEDGGDSDAGGMVWSASVVHCLSCLAMSTYHSPQKTCRVCSSYNMFGVKCCLFVDGLR